MSRRRQNPRPIHLPLTWKSPDGIVHRVTVYGNTMCCHPRFRRAVHASPRDTRVVTCLECITYDIHEAGVP